MPHLPASIAIFRKSTLSRRGPPSNPAQPPEGNEARSHEGSTTTKSPTFPPVQKRVRDHRRVRLCLTFLRESETVRNWRITSEKRLTSVSTYQHVHDDRRAAYRAGLFRSRALSSSRSVCLSVFLEWHARDNDRERRGANGEREMHRFSSRDKAVDRRFRTTR